MVAYSGADNLEVMTEAVNYNRFLTSLAKKSAGPACRALDFGAGIGTFAKSLRDSGLRVDCIEPDPAQAETLRNEGFVVYSGISDTPGASFEYIYSLNVLEHIDDDVSTLRQLHSKLKPGGRLLIYVPAFDLLYSSMDRKVGHRRRYTRQQLSSKLRAAGFDVEFALYCDAMGFFATLAYKWFGDRRGGISVPALVVYDRFVFPLSRLVDIFASRLFGKNVLAVAFKGPTQESTCILNKNG